MLRRGALLLLLALVGCGESPPADEERVEELPDVKEDPGPKPSRAWDDSTTADQVFLGVRWRDAFDDSLLVFEGNDDGVIRWATIARSYELRELLGDDDVSIALRVQIVPDSLAEDTLRVFYTNPVRRPGRVVWDYLGWSY